MRFNPDKYDQMRARDRAALHELSCSVYQARKLLSESDLLLPMPERAEIMYARGGGSIPECVSALQSIEREGLHRHGD